MSDRPPRLARALIRWLTPRGDRDFVLSDLDDAFERIRRERGPGSARRWYRRQAVTSIVPLLSSALAGMLREVRAGEVRGTLRSLRRRPQYAAGVAGTLTLGFASAIVLGGVAWHVWLRPLPLPDSEQLVRVWEQGRPDETGARVRHPVSPPLLHELRAREWTHLSGFAGILETAPEWIVDGEIRTLRGATVSPGFFGILGVRPLHGRADFHSRTGTEVPEVILSEPFWRSAFGGDPGIVGSTMDLAEVEHTIVGVVPASRGYPEPADLFTPLVFEERRLGEGMRGARYIEAVARVRPSSTIEAGSAEFSAFIERLGSAWPSHQGWSGEVVSLREDLAGPFRAVLRLLLAAGLTFLTLALVNVLGLSAARFLEHRDETAVRVALGASRGRLVRGALVEGAVLGFLGGAGALLLARLLLAASVGWMPEALPRAAEVHLSVGGSTLWLVLATCLGAAIVGLALRLVPVGPLRLSGTRASRSLVGSRALVVGQFALTTLLVSGGALVLERSLELADQDLGFRADSVWTGLVGLPESTHADWQERRASWTRLLRGIEDRGYRAAISTNPPMARANSNFPYGRFAEDELFGQYAIVSPDYFDVMSIPVLRGRTFTPGDTTPAALVSESLADEHFPVEDPVGLTLFINDEEHRIIGVVGSTAHFGPDSPEPPMMYVSYERLNWEYAHVVVAGGDGAPRAISAAIESSIRGAAPPAVAPYRRHLSQWFRPLRIQLGIVGALAVVGSLLAVLGLYSAIAFQVRGRMHELGIRLALGATGSSIVTGVLRRGLVTAGLGLLVGAVMWWFARGALGDAIDAAGAGLSPFSIGLTIVAILGLALVAVAAPARRAATADPLRSLRAE